ncbi:MAG: lipid A biosynthesis acyltransferase [Curvibacter sp.]|nr:lipid A biosynthesis acyltransferase [Curvibacter sp.]
MGSAIGLFLMRQLGRLPLPCLRGLGWLLGGLLYLLAVPRRRVVAVNLALCFPEAGAAQRRRWARRAFVYFAQSWLDRGWLWHASREVLNRRIRLIGDWHEFDGQTPTIIFSPHFFGLEAGGMALSLNVPRAFTSIFTPQPNPRVDAWMKAGRSRFGDVRMLNRFDGVKPIVSSLRQGGALYLLPDMNFGPEESIFVPFYGHLAATVPSLSRFARLGRAKVVPVVSRITPEGYEVEVMPAWSGFPTDDVEADTALMNQRLQGWIDRMPDQYYWVHKRFKTRPPGEPPVYR